MNSTGSDLPHPPARRGQQGAAEANPLALQVSGPRCQEHLHSLWRAQGWQQGVPVGVAVSLTLGLTHRLLALGNHTSIAILQETTRLG